MIGGYIGKAIGEPARQGAFAVLVSISVDTSVAVVRGIARIVAIGIDAAAAIGKSIPVAITAGVTTLASVTKDAGKTVAAGITAAASIVYGQLFNVFVSAGVTTGAVVRLAGYARTIAGFITGRTSGSTTGGSARMSGLTTGQARVGTVARGVGFIAGFLGGGPRIKGR